MCIRRSVGALSETVSHLLSQLFWKYASEFGTKPGNTRMIGAFVQKVKIKIFKNVLSDFEVIAKSSR